MADDYAQLREALDAERTTLLRRIDELTAGEKLGRIVTVDPAEVGFTRRRDLPRGEPLYAYKRHGEPCRRCGTPIVRADIDGRSIWWCPPCQPA